MSEPYGVITLTGKCEVVKVGGELNVKYQGGALGLVVSDALKVGSYDGMKLRCTLIETNDDTPLIVITGEDK